MKKAIIAIVAVAGLSLAYMYSSACCPTDCCTGNTECTTKANATDATLEVK